MLNKVTCCLGCGNRKVGCHGSCETYIKQKEANDELKATMQKEKALNFAVAETHYRNRYTMNYR